MKKWIVVFKCISRPKPDLTLVIDAEDSNEAKLLGMRDMQLILKYSTSKDKYQMLSCREAKDV